FNFFPSVRIDYGKSRTDNLSFYYNGNSQQPTMSQLQPIRENEDPLNVAIGNPNLRQSFQHSFGLQYFDFKVLTSEHMFLNANFNLIQNAITQKENIDISGKRTYQYVNVNGNYAGNFSGSYGRKIWKTLRGEAGLRLNYDKMHNFVNNLAN